MQGYSPKALNHWEHGTVGTDEACRINCAEQAFWLPIHKENAKKTRKQGKIHAETIRNSANL